MRDSVKVSQHGHRRLVSIITIFLVCVTFQFDVFYYNTNQIYFFIFHHQVSNLIRAESWKLALELHRVPL
jgi:hypothetical protein